MISRRFFLGAGGAALVAAAAPGRAFAKMLPEAWQEAAGHAVFVIYGTQSGIVRRVVSTDDPRSITAHVGAGESYLVAGFGVMTLDGSRNLVPALPAAIAAVERVRGWPSECGRCLVIDNNGDVVGKLMADPNIDRLAGVTLFQDSMGDEGHSPDALGNFSRGED